jgi:hypothetical protein
MGFSGVMLALSAVQGVAAIGQGYAKAGEDKANASLYTQQAGLIDVQNSITQGQYTRKAAQVLATSTADVAGKGLEPTGSAAAVMLDTQTQIHTDMAIAQFNNTMAKNQALAKAKLLDQQAGNDIFSGYSSAFSDMLQGAAQYGAYNSKLPSFNTAGGVYSIPGQTVTVA